MSRLVQLTLPDFGDELTLPLISPAEYETRLQGAVDRMTRSGLDFLLVYADREHFANLHFLTGFDPRFEEALLILDRRGNRTLLAGNEWIHYAPPPELHCRPVLFQEFSLLGQDRDESQPLRQILAEAGVEPGSVVGTAGWKYFERDHLVEGLGEAIEIPAYFVDLLRDMTGDRARVQNANAIFMGPQEGLRVINSADQIAQFEYAAIRTSTSVRRVLENLREGATEVELLRHHDNGSLQRSCHPTMRCGDWRPWMDPCLRTVRRGQFFHTSLGVWGALTCRDCAVARKKSDLPAGVGDFYEALFHNYFDTALAWLSHLRVGALGGEVFAAVEAARDAKLYRLLCNPGHYIHLDEWVHSPFRTGSRVELRSGMAVQLDIIPVSLGPKCASNVEDGFALADAPLRNELRARHPRCWQRIEARRRFLTDVIGAQLDESVLPLSNTPAWLTPYGLDISQALVAD